MNTTKEKLKEWWKETIHEVGLDPNIFTFQEFLIERINLDREKLNASEQNIRQLELKLKHETTKLLRDEFAMQVMSQVSWFTLAPPEIEGAKECYKIADIMIEARNKKE